MGQNVEYCNDKGTKQNEHVSQVNYETCGQKQKYTKEDRNNATEEHSRTKYVSAGVACRESTADGGSVVRRRKGSKSSGSTDGGERAAGCSVKSSGSEPPLAQRLSRCYEIKRATRGDRCTAQPRWQHGKYVRDECGSGIVPTRFDFEPNRRIWCRTPLSVYQATIGELARKILCGETVMARDVRGEPPSNIAEHIMPPCRGYYRKYECVRPCEDEFAVVKAGKKVFRDRVQQYWEPCLDRQQKHKLDINDYAPQNAFLALKTRRQNMTNDIHCW